MSLLNVRQRYNLSQVEVESQQQQQLLLLPQLGNVTSNTLDYFNLYRAISASPPHSLWRQRLENLLWIASAAFIVYYGDLRSNLVALLATDPRIHRYQLCKGIIYKVVSHVCYATMGLMIQFTCRSSCNWVRTIYLIPFNLGLACLILNLGILLYLALRLRTVEKVEERLEIVAPGAIPAATMIGLAAFILFSYAVWPIWRFLTLPMLFTLMMALVVTVPHLESYYMSLKVVDGDAMRGLHIRSSYSVE